MILTKDCPIFLKLCITPTSSRLNKHRVSFALTSITGENRKILSDYFKSHSLKLTANKTGFNVFSQKNSRKIEDKESITIDDGSIEFKLMLSILKLF